MAEVSVLLNLTTILALEDTDPFMSLVADKGMSADRGTLLFYDQLSVRRFPTDRTRYSSHLERLLADLRNLLESRSLSVWDRGEDIRLIVLLDLAYGLFEPEEGNKRSFPAQKVRLFKQAVERVFGSDNPILPRFRYFFVFIESTLPSSVKLSSFYRSAAYEGFTGDASEWINESTIKVGPKPEFSAPPDENIPIESLPEALAYLWDVRKVAEIAGGYLDLADAGNVFRELVDKKLRGIQHWKDFVETDFDQLLRSSVSRVIGLSGVQSKNDGAYFIMKFAGSPASSRRRDEIYALSLVLLLVTISRKDYEDLFVESPGRVFVMGSMPAENHIDTDRLFKLYECIRFCSGKLKETGDIREKKDGRVSFKIYASRAQSPKEIDTHTPLNTETEAKQKEFYNVFKDKRRVPFFFGDHPDDWTWYISVEEAMEKLLQHERENSRPLHDPPRRITDREMSYTEKECSYTELENMVSRLTESETEDVPVADIHSYMQIRNQQLDELETVCAKMKQEMLKLGYLRKIAWVTVFLVLAITICYSFHFFLNKSIIGLQWSGVCAIVCFLLFLIGMMVARFQIKQRIESNVQDFEKIYNQLNKDRKDYLDKITERTRRQNEADIRRRNLAEMQEKLNCFKLHNLQVDKWETYFTALCGKMKDTLDLLRLSPPEKSDEFKMQEGVFAVENFPTIPPDLASSFYGSKTSFSCFNGKTIDDVVCFVKNFEVTKME